MTNHGNHLKKFLVTGTVLFVFLAIAYNAFKPPGWHEGCLESNEGWVVCAASDMARVTRDGPVLLEHADFDISNGELSSSAARNETIGFQLISQQFKGSMPNELSVDASPWKLHIDQASGKNDHMPIIIHEQRFLAHYHRVDNAGYTWGPESNVLDWPAEYPDALIPEQHGCGQTRERLWQSLTLPTKGQNQSLWIDLYVPADTPPGDYERTFRIASLSVDDSAGDADADADGEATVEFTQVLTVVNATLPDKPSIEAVGEIYRSYRLEGAGEDRSKKQWQTMAQCYQHLAHAHRMVFIERTPEAPGDGDWEAYEKTYAPILDGSLFTAENGYVGPGADTPVTVWRTPWPQTVDVELPGPLPTTTLEQLAVRASEWSNHVSQRGWNQTRYFAYLFDEVDGPNAPINIDMDQRDYLAMVHGEMERVQDTLDIHSGEIPIDLMWTSHSNPAAWADDTVLDLRDKVRFWAPNASAADVSFLQARAALGETVWFYHSGHPAIGVHSINASGIEMRTWGVAAARYGLQGNLMWAVNLGSDERPFAEPMYKPDDDRFGNGVLVYPGNQLPRIGFSAMPGPLPSMRLKAWRRGLQDAELYQLAYKLDPTNAEALIKTVLPEALSEGLNKAAWSNHPSDWIEFRHSLLALVATPISANTGE